MIDLLSTIKNVDKYSRYHRVLSARNKEPGGRYLADAARRLLADVDIDEILQNVAGVEARPEL